MSQVGFSVETYVLDQFELSRVINCFFDVKEWHFEWLQSGCGSGRGSAPTAQCHEGEEWAKGGSGDY